MDYLDRVTLPDTACSILDELLDCLENMDFYQPRVVDVIKLRELLRETLKEAASVKTTDSAGH